MTVISIEEIERGEYNIIVLCDGAIHCSGGREEMNCGEYNYSIV